MARPSGSWAFLFTDIEDSTRLWAEHTAAMDSAVSRHDEILTGSADRHHGLVFSRGGDGYGIAFAHAAEAVAVALESQLAFAQEPWPDLNEAMRVRMGLHVGQALERRGDFFGPDVNLAARIMSAAWGGQILLSDEVVAAVEVSTASLGSHRLRGVPGDIALHQILDPGLPSVFPAPRTLDLAPSTLPSPLSSFVGRRVELIELWQRLVESRLVTLVGPGGTGKTRLAIEVARRASPRHPGGTYFADLASVERPEHVADAVGRACLVPPEAGGDAMELLVDLLSDRDALLVIDNCEHVIDQVAKLVDRTLTICPDVRVIATSREALELTGEHVHPVQPFDPAGEDARMLFSERVEAAGGATAEFDDDVIAELCARVDGIPLAIELAASLVRTITPSEVLDGLDREPVELSGRRRGGPDRHRTLRAAIDWSYRLLDEEDRWAFDRLSVFVGPFDRAAAASVLDGGVRGADLLLDDLVARSMVSVASDGGSDDSRRFRLLDTLRAYGVERLDTDAARGADARRAHARHFLESLATEAPARAMSKALVDAHAVEIEDLRVAFDRADPGTDGFGEAAFRFAIMLTNLGLTRESRTLTQRSLSDSVLDDPTHGALLVARAFADATEDGTSAFAESAALALTHLRPGDGVWAAAVGLTQIPLQMFSPSLAVPSLEGERHRLDALVGPDADNDRAMLDFYLGGALLSGRRVEAATDAYVRSATTMAVTEPTSLVRIWSLCGAAIALAMNERAEEGLAALHEIEDLVEWTDWSVEWAFAKAYVLGRLGRMDEARQPLEAFGARLGSRGRPSPLSPTVVAGFGVLAQIAGDRDRARRLLGGMGATRTAASTAAMYEAIAFLEGWTDDEFENERIRWAIESAAGRSPDDGGAYFARLTLVAHEEVARAGHVIRR